MERSRRELYRRKETKEAMKDRVISLSIGKTTNIGNYENIKVDVFVSGKIEDGKKLSTEFAKLSKELNKELTDQIKHRSLLQQEYQIQRILLTYVKQLLRILLSIQMDFL